MRRSKLIKKTLLQLKQEFLERKEIENLDEGYDENEQRFFEYQLDYEYNQRKKFYEKYGDMEWKRKIKIINDFEDELIEYLKNEETGKISYEEKELIWWKGTEKQIIHLFDLLFHNNLIDRTQINNRYALIRDHFKNKNGKAFNNKQLAIVDGKNSSIKNKETLEVIVESTLKNK